MCSFCKRVLFADDDIDNDEDSKDSGPSDGYGDGGYGDGGEGGEGGYGDEDEGYDGGDGTRAPAGSSPRDITSLDELKSFLAEDELEPAVIGFFDEATNADDLTAFKEVRGSIVTCFSPNKIMVVL